MMFYILGQRMIQPEAESFSSFSTHVDFWTVSFASVDLLTHFSTKSIESSALFFAACAVSSTHTSISGLIITGGTAGIRVLLVVCKATCL